MTRLLLIGHAFWHMLFSMTDGGSQSSDGSRAGWYAVGGALGTAGVTLWSVGFTKGPPSHGLEFFGLIAFVVGLVVIILAMPRLRTRPKPKAVPAGNFAHRKPSTAVDLRQISTVVAALAATVVGGFFIFSGQSGAIPPYKPAPSTSSSSPTASPSSPGPSSPGPTPTNISIPFGSIPVGACVDLPPASGGEMILTNCASLHDAELNSMQTGASSKNGSTIYSLECQDQLNQFTVASTETEQAGGTLDYSVPTTTLTINSDGEDYCFFTAGSGQQLQGSFPPSS
jgi:hypothetical protein